MQIPKKSPLKDLQCDILSSMKPFRIKTSRLFSRSAELLCESTGALYAAQGRDAAQAHYAATMPGFPVWISAGFSADSNANRGGTGYGQFGMGRSFSFSASR